jgi:hypothetical protein
VLIRNAECTRFQAGWTEPTASVLSSNSTYVGIRDALQHYSNISVTAAGPRGCLVTNTTIELRAEDTDLAKCIKSGMKQITELLKTRSQRQVTWKLRRNALGGMIRQAGQDVGEPSRWIDIVEFGGRDEGLDRSRTPAAIIRAGGNRVHMPNRRRPPFARPLFFICV